MSVDYEHPHVERLSALLPDRDGRPSGLRVLLHRIHPCERGQPLRHAHPWPSAVLIVSGMYEHTTGSTPWPLASDVVTVLAAGSSYQIAAPDVWHSVRPLGAPSCSIMLCGPTWSAHHSSKAPKAQRELTEAERLELRSVFAPIINGKIDEHT